MTHSNSQVGPFEVKEEINRGGISTVYHATDTRNDYDVALKIFANDTDTSKIDLDRFIEEGQNAEVLDHPNIVPLYEAGNADGTYYIALELVAAEPLSSYLEQKDSPVLSIDETIKIIQQIAEGLDYAHQHGFVHRDIKPRNLLISEDGHAYISDFGLAKQSAANDNNSVFTKTSGSVGTPQYISPEQATGELDVDHRTDIYSLAVVTYKLLTGKLPLKAKSQSDLLYKLVYETPPSPEKVNPSIPPGTAYAINRALSKEMQMRHGSAGSFAEALEEGKSWVPSPAAYQFLEETPNPFLQESASQAGPHTPHAGYSADEAHLNKKSKMPLLLATLVGLLAFSILAIYLLSQPYDWNGTSTQSTNTSSTPTTSEQTTESDLSPALDTDAPIDDSSSNSEALNNTALDNAVANVVSSVLDNDDDLSSNEDTQDSAAISDENEVVIADPERLAPYSQYRSPQNQFSLQVPSLWRRNVSANSVNFDSSEPFARIFVRDMGPVDQDQSPESLIEQYVQNNSNSFNNLALVENSSQRLSNGAFRQEYGAVWLNKEVILSLSAISGDDKAYILGFVTESDTRDEFSASFEKIANSFILVSANPEGSNGVSDNTVAVAINTPTAEPTIRSTPPAPTEITESIPASVTSTEATATEQEVATNTPVPAETSATARPTATPQPTATIQPTSTAQPTPTAQPTATTAPPAVAIFDFEEFGDWQLGTEAWGTFTQSSQRPYAGTYAGQFVYEFPASAGNQNYLAFYKTKQIEERPDALRMQVYGDGSGVFINVWLTDATRQTWQFTFGNVDHVGWQEMVAPLNLERGWPNGLIGSNAGTSSTIQYPITFIAFSLDGVDNNTLQRGTIYIDDLVAGN